MVQPAAGPAPHAVVPDGHAQAPEVQTAPEPQRMVHEPQCCGLIEVSKQPPPGPGHVIAGA